MIAQIIGVLGTVVFGTVETLGQLLKHGLGKGKKYSTTFALLLLFVPKLRKILG
jgi:hypothetical protein